MKRRSRPIRIIVATAASVAAVAIFVTALPLGGGETPADPQVLERIARKNDQAAVNAAVALEEKAEESAAASDRLRDAEDRARETQTH